MGAKYCEPGTGRFTQPEPAWTNPMFNTLGGRNVLVARSYGTGATVGQEAVPLPGGYYWPGSEYNWYSDAGSDPANAGDDSGYWKRAWRFKIGRLSIFGSWCVYIGAGIDYEVGSVAIHVDKPNPKEGVSHIQIERFGFDKKPWRVRITIGFPGYP